MISGDTGFKCRQKPAKKRLFVGTRPSFEGVQFVHFVQSVPLFRKLLREESKTSPTRTEADGSDGIKIRSDRRISTVDAPADGRTESAAVRI